MLTGQLLLHPRSGVLRMLTCVLLLLPRSGVFAHADVCVAAAAAPSLPQAREPRGHYQVRGPLQQEQNGGCMFFVVSPNSCPTVPRCGACERAVAARDVAHDQV